MSPSARDQFSALRGMWALSRTSPVITVTARLVAGTTKSCSAGASHACLSMRPVITRPGMKATINPATTRMGAGPNSSPNSAAANVNASMSNVLCLATASDPSDVEDDDVSAVEHSGHANGAVELRVRGGRDRPLVLESPRLKVGVVDAEHGQGPG